jgi:hypothetical protein
MITVLYYTDNSFKGKLAEAVRSRIKEITDAPIISVSQEPLDFGRNLCIGKIGRSLQSINKQLLMGLIAVETPYVALAEHDTLYPDKYFDWIPPSRDTFYYADNTIWVVAKKGPQYGQFMTHFSQRPSLESLVCDTDILFRAIERRVKLAESGVDLPRGWQEPGYAYEDEKYEMHSLAAPVIDIKHNDNYTMREGCMTKVFWEAEGWGRFEDIV